MKWPIAFSTVALAATPLLAQAAQADLDLTGRSVTYQACVTRGVTATIVRLADVREVGDNPITVSTPMELVYWMDKAHESKLRDLQGARIEVVATIVEESERPLMEFTVDDGVFAIETKMPQDTPADTSGRGGNAQIESRVFKVDVQNIRRVGTCR